MPDLPEPLPAVIHHFAQIPDITDRARAVAVALKAIPDLQAALAGIRRDTVLTMQQTVPNDVIAEALGISVPRVSQIAKGVSRSTKRGAPATA